MRKTVIISVLLTLATGLLFLILLKSRAPFGKNNTSFASEPQKEITKIEFSDGSRKLYLEKVNENWLINGKNETRKSGILFILRALKEIKIKSPISDELFNNEIRGKKVIPVKVKVYEKRKLLKSFLVYKTSSNVYGNIMKMKETSKPFIVYMPGFEGDIGSGFTFNELFWQPYTVFNLLPSEIASVDFENLSDTTASFLITSKNRQFTLSDRYRNLSGWDTALVTRFLSYFTWVPFESWAFDLNPEEKKMIESQKPLYRITVNTNMGIKTVLSLWERMAGKNGSGTKDSDRLYAKTQKRDELFIIRFFDIDPLLKKRSYFFPE
ncbi:MAG: hypothetical protein EPN88_14930 [Bacteroidetes bacterium]|nr:MAG: hypothetical protein EPN88_14930 [Bacteroidota bacterium]